MAKIKIAVAGLPFSEKLQKGQLIITKETDNPDVPDNEALVLAFSEAQAELKAAVQAATAAREESMRCTLVQANAEKKWRRKLNALASYTEAVTEGAAVKLLGAGFEVRAESTPTHVPEMVGPVNVKLDPTPGRSKLTWKPMPDADGYVVQGSPTPTAATGWTESILTTKASCLANGATPGQEYWYRVAAFNSAGQGPWSAPASRPVM